MIAMVSNGLIDLSPYEVTEFQLTSIDDAVAHAAITSGPFNKTVLRF
jgi:hypothetical protein